MMAAYKQYETAMVKKKKKVGWNLQVSSSVRGSQM